jgi:hypothetical protein
VTEMRKRMVEKAKREGLPSLRPYEFGYAHLPWCSASRRRSIIEENCICARTMRQALNTIPGIK